MSIKLIANVDMNNGIGDEEGNLLFDIKKDKEFFKNVTSGKTVVMGRVTWESLPDAHRPLKKRKNYIMTNDINYKSEGAKLLHSVEEVVELAKSRDVYIIGGEKIYEQFIDLAVELILTHVHSNSPFAYTFFPDFEPKDWALQKMTKHEADEDCKFSFTFANYKRK